MGIQDYLAMSSLVFSIIAFIVSLLIKQRAKKSEEQWKIQEVRLREIAKEAAAKAALIQALQGEKEAIGFTALRLSKEGLPQDRAYREQILLALVQAAVFSGSDRARAMVYSVLCENYHANQSEIQATISSLENKFKEFEQYQMDKAELDLERGNRRLATLKKVLTEGRS